MTPQRDSQATSNGHDLGPVVRLPNQGVPGAIIAISAVAFALILFFVLNGQRQQRATAPLSTVQADGFVAPPPLRLPVLAEAPSSTPPAVIITTPAPVVPLSQNQRPTTGTFSQPVIVPIQPAPLASLERAAPERPKDGKTETAMVFDLGAEPASGGISSTSPPVINGARGASGGSGSSDDSPAQATTMRSRTDIVPIGTLVPIALETPIDTARPGLVRAIASRDTRGFDGRRILIPRGSRFIGEYQADIRSGQKRVLVTWTRVIRPDGVTIRLGSPAADQLGGSGIPGKVNSFFLQRFAGAVLQSALTVGVNLASRPRSGSVVVGIPSGPITSIGQGLVPNDYRPKITVKQGEALNVFVARDLDFSGLTTGQR